MTAVYIPRPSRAIPAGGTGGSGVAAGLDGGRRGCGDAGTSPPLPRAATLDRTLLLPQPYPANGRANPSRPLATPRPPRPAWSRYSSEGEEQLQAGHDGAGGGVPRFADRLVVFGNGVLEFRVTHSDTPDFPNGDEVRVFAPRGHAEPEVVALLHRPP